VSLLVDAQLPVALARYLSALGWPTVHIADLGLIAATDRTIWHYACDNGLAIVTKDQDFIALALQQGSIPPQVLWVRLGNCRRKMLLDAFAREWRRIHRELSSGKLIVELA
jgi:predicted nuclease of predicted toxin-antitoxin system